jgi:glycosyltransferase involved in cell wall biosynthesis
MPVYNEEECIQSVIESWLDVLQKIEPARLLIIDDGSKDKTGAVLDKLAQKHKRLTVIHQVNGGHGSAVYNGYMRALTDRAEWIFQVDSDDQIPAKDFTLLWNRRDESPFILGRRFDRHDPIYRIILSRINRALIFLVFGVYLRDPNIPFRLMRGDFLSGLFKKFNLEGIFAPNVFLSILARKNGAPTLDIPIEHKIRESGTPSLKPLKLIKVCLRCIKELFLLRIKV